MKLISKICAALLVVFVCCAVISCCMVVKMGGSEAGLDLIQEASEIGKIPKNFGTGWIGRLAEGIGNGFGNAITDGTGFIWNSNDTDGLVDASKKQEFDSVNVKSIKIEVIMGSIEFRESPSNKVIVDYQAFLDSKLSKKHRLDISDNNGSVKVEQIFERHKFWLPMRNNVKLIVYLPKGSKIDVDAETVSGAFIAQKLSFRNLSAKITNGSANFEMINCEKATVTGVNGELNISTVGSQLTKIKVETVNGAISIVTDSASPKIDANTVNGSTTIQLPKNAAFEYSLETVNGSIDIDEAFGGAKKSRGDLSGKTNENASGEIDVSTVNGAIEIKSSLE